MKPRKFTKRKVMEIFEELNEAIHEEDRMGKESDGQGIHEAAYRAWVQLAGVLGVKAEHVEADPEEKE